MPTFGNTTIKAIAASSVRNYLLAFKYPLAEEGQITHISCYLSAAAGNIRHAIYSDNAGAPDALQCETDSAVAAIGWNTLPTLTNPILQPGDYWIVTLVSSNTSEFRYQAGDPNQEAYRAYAFAAFPDPFGVPTGYTNHDFSIYSTYSLVAIAGFASVF